MASYLLDVMCARNEYPYLGWKWTPSLSSIHVYCTMLWENRYKEDYDRICDGFFAPIYQILFGKEAPCFSPKGQEIVQKYGDWYMTPDGFYIRMSGTSKAPHRLPHFVPDKSLLQELTYQTYIHGVATSLHKEKRVFGLLFLYPPEFKKLKILSMSRKRLIFYPPPSSKR